MIMFPESIKKITADFVIIKCQAPKNKYAVFSREEFSRHKKPEGESELYVGQQFNFDGTFDYGEHIFESAEEAEIWFLEEAVEKAKKKNKGIGTTQLPIALQRGLQGVAQVEEEIEEEILSNNTSESDPEIDHEPSGDMAPLFESEIPAEENVPAENKEIIPKKPAIKKLKTEQKLLSPRGTNYVISKSKMPDYTVKQEALIDFIFSKLHTKAKKMTPQERSLITLENLDMAIRDRDEFPPALTGFSFETSEVRKAIGRYPEKQMVKDFRELRSKEIHIKNERIWADKNGKYETVSNLFSSILSAVATTKTTKIAPRTGEPLYKIHLALGLSIGILWLNDSIRKKYRLFPKSFYSLPEQCQKIYRYLSLFRQRHLYLYNFQNILNYKPTKNLAEQKKLIGKYLDILKTTDISKGQKYISDWKRIEGTRGLETQWYIQIVEKC